METELAVEHASGLFIPLKSSSMFRALWLGQTFSRLGDNILFIVLPIVVYSQTGSTMDMGLLMTFLTLPQVILLPFTGLIVDRFSRTWLMIMTDIVRFVLLGAVMLLYIFYGLNMMMLDLFAVVYGSMEALFMPAYSAARAQVFTPNIRNAANSLTEVSQQTAKLVGPALGGLILTFGSAGAGFGFDAVTFLVSIFSLLFLKLPFSRTSINQNVQNSGFVQELMGGYHELRKHGWLWMTILAFAFVNIAFGGIIFVLVPWLIKVHFGFPAYVYGLVASGQGVGAILAAALFGRRTKWHNRGILAYLGTGVTGASLVFTIFTNWIPGLIAFMALSGAGLVVFGLIWETSLQELVPEDAFGRVASLDMFGSISLMPIGFILTGWLAGHIGGTITLGAEAMSIVVIAIGMLFIPAIRNFD